MAPGGQASAKAEHPNPAAAQDVHSYGRPAQVRVSHIGLALDVDFSRKQLDAVATLALDRQDGTKPLRLDTRALNITSIEVATLQTLAGSKLAAVSGQWAETKWTLHKADPILGQGLEVVLPAGANTVRVHYTTAPTASGLQWLAPEQTADGKAPFLYSQSQAIHARSWIPCQDSPGVRVTYDAEIKTPKNVRALMSAKRFDASSDRVTRYAMDKAVPPYLIALAVGAVEFKELGPRTGVWAEASVLPKATREFGGVEAMITAIEQLYGPYRWERYDVLVLPPAFPFGGMENPRLTFATPTILAGDRSLIALIVHELAHSWSGNLVTNKVWADLWLNEGFTVYIERRIVEELYGRERAEMEAMLGRQDLTAELAELDDADEHLFVDLSGRDPDVGLTDVPYEKGALFLRALEETYGRAAFDPFLKLWFSEHAFGTVTTKEFERFLQEHLIAKHKPLAGHKPVDPKAWIHAPGVPAGAPVPKSDAFTQVDAQLAAFASGGKAGALAVKDWTPHQWLHFLRALPKDLSAQRLGELDQAFDLTASTNSEIHAQWLNVSVHHGYAQADAALERFLLRVGRRKFLTPLYRALIESDRAADAKRIYAKARSGYHPITQRTLDELIG